MGVNGRPQAGVLRLKADHLQVAEHEDVPPRRQGPPGLALANALRFVLRPAPVSPYPAHANTPPRLDTPLLRL